MLNRKPTSTFLIVMVVVDSGYEGPQSNLNNLDDLHSISGIKVNLIGDSLSVHHCFSKDMDFCEIIAVSQNSLKRPIQKADKGEIINGFNCESIVDILQDSNPILINFGLSTELFENTSETLKLQRFVFHSVRQVTINKQDNLNFAEKIATANRKIVVFDSSKSRNKVSEGFCLELEKKGISPLYLTRDDEDSWMRVSHDKFTVNEDLLNDYLLEPTRGKTKC